MTVLEEELNSISLSVGNVVIQKNTGFVGILVERYNNDKYENTLFEDLYFWRVTWLRNVSKRISDEMTPFLNSVIEEEGLKMSILLGSTELHTNTKKQ
tara:strand:+ start:1306 stop:1599 length:294 start_codon:yes stop_codon:yes gene_type:complete